MKISILIVIIIVTIVLFESGSSVHRDYRRKSTFKKARERANKLGIPLIVIGDPHNGPWSSIIGERYGSGDYCIDLAGCKSKKCKNIIKADAKEALKGFNDKSAVIFESCVMEYVSDLKGTQKEIDRVGKEKYQVRIGPAFMHLYYYPKLWSEGGNIKQYVKN